MALLNIFFMVIVSLVGSQAQLQRPACPKICTLQYDPICGSDNITYSNLCTLQVKNCNIGGSKVTVLHEGECGKVAVKCPDVCGAIYLPVCGTDDVTYSNECELRAINCPKQGTNPVTVAYIGECSELDSSREKDCPEFCTADYSPVCGTDDVTYSNECQLIVENCPKHGSSVTVAYNGECKKNCPDRCAFIFNPVCGTDSVTYSNQCQLDADNCQKEGPEVKVAYPGECRADTEAECTSGSRWKTTCNWCRCSYGRPSCTKRRCLIDEIIVPMCVSESRWKEDCNWCDCVNGKPSCTEIFCGADQQSTIASHGR